MCAADMSLLSARFASLGPSLARWAPPPPPLVSSGCLGRSALRFARSPAPALPYPRNLNLSGTSSSTPRLALAQLHQGSGLGFEQTVKP